MHTAALCPIAFSPCASPTVVVDLPSPSGVGEIAVTSTYLPRGRSASRRSIPSSVTFAFHGPYSSSSSSWIPRSRATPAIGRGLTERAISRSDGKVIDLLRRERGGGPGAPRDRRAQRARATTTPTTPTSLALTRSAPCAGRTAPAPPPHASGGSAGGHSSTARR